MTIHSSENLVLAALLATGLLTSATVLAGEGPGFYGGGSVGLSHYEDQEDEIRGAFAPTAISVETDDSDLGWKLFGGYRFTPYFGAEVSFVDLGEQSVDIGVGTASVTATNSVSGVSLTGTAGYPVIPQGYVFGRLGGYVWDSSVDTEGNALLNAIATANGAIDEGDNGVDLTFGLGATYELVEHVKVRADWERFNGLGENETDIDLFSGGIQYDF
jgi:OOP family OmpA-OmpF porin